MKILHTIYDDIANPWLGGGGAVRAYEINRRLASSHDITVVCGRYPGGDESETREGVRILRVGSEAGYARSRLGFIAGASDRVGREPFDIWVNTFSAFSPVMASAEIRQRAMLEFHHHMGIHAIRKRPIFGFPALLAEQAVLRAYPHVVGVSPSVLEAVARRRGREGLHLVYNGVSDDCFNGPRSEGDFVLYFGRFDIHTKGLDLLLPAFADACRDLDVRLVLAGRGTDADRLWVEGRVRALGMNERVEIAGPVSDNRKAELMGGCLFAVQPSRYEGWGITAMEASAAGKAVVGTRIAGLVDAIKDGETGLLIPPEDEAALAAAIRKMATDSALRTRLGEAGGIYAREFTWDRVAREHERVCNHIVEYASQESIY